MIVNGATLMYPGMMAAKKSPTKEPEQKFVLRLPESLHHALRHVAIDRKTSLNALVIEALEAWWARQPERGMYVEREAAGRKPRRTS